MSNLEYIWIGGGPLDNGDTFGMGNTGYYGDQCAGKQNIFQLILIYLFAHLVATLFHMMPSNAAFSNMHMLWESPQILGQSGMMWCGPLMREAS